MPWACCLWQGLFQLLANAKRTHENTIPTFLCSGDGNLASKEFRQIRVCNQKGQKGSTGRLSIAFAPPCIVYLETWLQSCIRKRVFTGTQDKSSLMFFSYFETWLQSCIRKRVFAGTQDWVALGMLMHFALTMLWRLAKARLRVHSLKANGGHIASLRS